MTDDIQNSPKEEASQYEPQPRGQARIPGIQLDAIDSRLAECTEFFQKHCDETDYRNLDWYLWRMQLRYAAGDDIFDVVDDAFLAARCLHDKHTMHLELKPPEMFMTRRIVPVELGILSGMPMLTLEFSATYGLPLMMVLGQTAPEDIMGEANLMTSFFRRGFCADFVELTGLSAVIYAGVIAAIGRGFDDEATLGLSTYARARDSLRGMPPAALLPKIKRYDALNTALACLCAGNFEMIGEILAPAADAFVQEQARRLGESWLNPDKMPPPKYFDVSILTILALAVLRGKVIELPQTGAIAGYRDFMRGLTEMPERRIEIPGLDEETRRILEQAGIDPDQMGVDHTYEDEKAASEAKAAELFEERQRKAQEYVRAKLAQGKEQEEDHTAVEPAQFAKERLLLHEDDEQESTTQPPRSYADFFSNDDKEDEAARRANDEEQQDSGQNSRNYDAFFDGDKDIPRSDNNEEEQDNRQSKDFSAFFDQNSREDDSLRANIEEENAEHTSPEQGNKDFSQFFRQDNPEDDSIRTHVEEESAQEADTGQSYASFFDNLPEDAIPKFDDGTSETRPEAKTFSSDFFSSEHPVSSDLKMTLDVPKPVEQIQTSDESRAASSIEASNIEQSLSAEALEFEKEGKTGRDFSNFFDETPENTVNIDVQADSQTSAANKFEEETTESPKTSRDFSKFFDEPDERRENNVELDYESQLRELEEEQARKKAQTLESEKLKLVLDDAEQAEEESPKHMVEVKVQTDLPASQLNEFEGEDASEISQPGRDFSKFFDETDERRENNEDQDYEAQLRELEEEQVRKKVQKLEAEKLKLALDGTEKEVQVAESYQARMARLIAEKQEAAREMALRERAEAERELEELRQHGIAKPVVEQLQLKPTDSTDPDEIVDKVAPEDLVIKGFAYTDLDMIHANTAIREESEEDFDLHAAVAKQQFEEAQNKDNAVHAASENDDDLHVVIDYGALSGNLSEQKED